MVGMVRRNQGFVVGVELQLLLRLRNLGRPRILQRIPGVRRAFTKMITVDLAIWFFQMLDYQTKLDKIIGGFLFPYLAKAPNKNLSTYVEAQYE